MRRIVWYGGLFLGFVFLLICSGFLLPLDLALNLAVGWVAYLVLVVPQVTVDWGGVSMAAICLVLFAIGSHIFLRWFYSQTGPEGQCQRWEPRWSAAMVAVVVLMFAAGIAATGVAHQVGWLLTSPEPWTVGWGGARIAAGRAQSASNLKHIGLGLHGRHRARGTFPPGGTFDEHGQMLHGWQTEILPYMDVGNLYNSINFEVPWDDSQNALYFQFRVQEYRNPAIPDEKDEAGYALSHYAGNAKLLGGDAPRSLDDVTDGTSTTLLGGEVAAQFRPWGYPANWRDPAKGINRTPDGFGSPFPGGANFLFVDGSVQFLRETIDPNVLKALGTPTGGEVIDAGSL